MGAAIEGILVLLCAAIVAVYIGWYRPNRINRQAREDAEDEESASFWAVLKEETKDIPWPPSAKQTGGADRRKRTWRKRTGC